MNKTQKFLLMFIGICMLLVIGLIAFNVFMPKPEITAGDVNVSERSVQEEVVEDPQQKSQEVAKEYEKDF